MLVMENSPRCWLLTLISWVNVNGPPSLSEPSFLSCDARDLGLTRHFSAVKALRVHFLLEVSNEIFPPKF